MFCQDNVHPRRQTMGYLSTHTCRSDKDPPKKPVAAQSEHKQKRQRTKTSLQPPPRYHLLKLSTDFQSSLYMTTLSTTPTSLLPPPTFLNITTPPYHPFFPPPNLHFLPSEPYSTRLIFYSYGLPRAWWRRHQRNHRGPKSRASRMQICLLSPCGMYGQMMAK